MLYSMTGFGKGEALFSDGRTMQIEISSVNRKQFEARFIMPQELAALENSGRKFVASLVSRGAIQVRVNIGSSSGSAGVAIDRNMLDMLISEAAAARQRNGMSGEVNVEALLSFPGVMTGTALDGSFHLVCFCCGRDNHIFLIDFEKPAFNGIFICGNKGRHEVPVLFRSEG